MINGIKKNSSEENIFRTREEYDDFIKNRKKCPFCQKVQFLVGKKKVSQKRIKFF